MDKDIQALTDMGYTVELSAGGMKVYRKRFGLFRKQLSDKWALLMASGGTVSK